MLTDFGMAKAAGRRELMKTMCGTFQYIAPEMISSGAKPGEHVKQGYTTAVDCWSLGVMTYAMVSGMLPFSDDEGNPQILFSQILSGYLDFTAPCWRELSLECQSFVFNLLRVNPDKRMSVDKALQHSWILKDEPRLLKLYNACIDTNSTDDVPGTPETPTTPSSNLGAGKSTAAKRRIFDDDEDDEYDDGTTTAVSTPKSEHQHQRHGETSGLSVDSGATRAVDGVVTVMGPPPAKRQHQ
ncbi:hypothetical protein LPJ66_010237 [Kickxella alabastrina]|uniref:Uncharacterized protein n=1 Tax=Kickxella alabastrina TaxID=61397 RepID=A0ACC1I8X9_9FUNG|nr:hypothetical protein LPJ66_010237 [Kickxella alabastrina]